MTQCGKVIAAVGLSVCSTLLAMYAISQVPGLEIPPPYWAFGALCPALISAPVSWVLTRQAAAIQLANEQLLHAQSQLQQRADYDDLTGVLNRSAFYREAELARTHATSACMLLADIDYFKQVNDRHGHGVGDQVLECVAKALLGSIAKKDLIGRIGGEEFAILLDGLALDDALQVAERARFAVEQLRCMGANGQLVRVSISIGVALFPPGTPIGLALLQADRAMYRAKDRGRNRVLIAA